MLKTEIAILGYVYLSDANSMSWIIMDDHATSLNMHCLLYHPHVPPIRPSVPSPGVETPHRVHLTKLGVLGISQLP